MGNLASNTVLKLYGLQLKPKLLPNGPKLGSSCAILESWAEVDPKLDHVGAKWSLWAILG